MNFFASPNYLKMQNAFLIIFRNKKQVVLTQPYMGERQGK